MHKIAALVAAGVTLFGVSAIESSPASAHSTSQVDCSSQTVSGKWACLGKHAQACLADGGFFVPGGSTLYCTRPSGK